VTDTNVLQRVSRGKAMRHVETLRGRGVRLTTTDRNALELRRNLVADLGLDEAAADVEMMRVLAPFELIIAEEYEFMRPDADARLREGGKSDWPALAAALALDADIWSGDVDYFGVGVPVWTTANLRFVEQDR
jgi:hypothetical protein